MNEREYAVRVWDREPGAEERIVPVGNRYQADKRVELYGQLGATATVVYRYSFMPDMPWEDA